MLTTNRARFMRADGTLPPLAGAEEPESPAEAAAPEAPAAPPAAAEPQAGPWSSDIEAMFTDPAVRQQVDQFMRDKYQPYVTRIEQESAPARQLYKDLQEDPETAYLAITRELFGDEAVEAVVAAFQADDEAGQQPAQPEAQEQNPGLDPRVQELIEEKEAREAAEAYETELARVKQAYQGELDEQQFALHVMANEGDFDAALASYTEQFASRYVPKPAEQPAEVPTAPPTVGTEPAGSPAPPATEPQYQSLGEALDDFMNEQRQASPPAVGTV